MTGPEKNVQTPAPCENCNGTGKAPADGTAPTSQTPAASYAHGVCPVCGGSGKQPDSTIHSDSKNKNCFVATVAFESIDAPEVRTLRRFRDTHLLPHRTGRAFVRGYYRFGPYLAGMVGGSRSLKKATRALLSRLCRRIEPHL
ncbi:CFI-box-CTERM domain-containing protein [Pelagicoccus sp. SDUM812003]|uniref:CFI-box-CTERM domain-containing protein n=1 Tax=Pelagicoccus sp. SDUM812003 TaxID=3041267 RepID=UPI00280CD367|nr:CFI-box-CTERM domain-containing protein [Pelagicoccus sp. SDUM812003]MDQ8204010.1 hypothetical protein [Pelagicoccus sp. SDUM812003]